MKIKITSAPVGSWYEGINGTIFDVIYKIPSFDNVEWFYVDGVGYISPLCAVIVCN